ncbi:MULTISPECIES: DUF2274 domain-containing protein [Bradyrhizobium]|uniref:DUF2274 domain-containing protein n=1 Tax=Bradyrhizobium TaxID=374 RepID=UPI0020231D98|nr:DUF2274 domain-containing protein [Bradyrhizobium denitrificans]MCL8482862.1 DUF2274 domain-containing protein [Bradyrhizobium denitrificans]
MIWSSFAVSRSTTGSWPPRRSAGSRFRPAHRTIDHAADHDHVNDDTVERGHDGNGAHGNERKAGQSLEDKRERCRRACQFESGWDPAVEKRLRRLQVAPRANRRRSRRLTVELPANVHWDLQAYTEVIARKSGLPSADLGRLAAAMAARFMATDRVLAKSKPIITQESTWPRSSHLDGRYFVSEYSVWSDGLRWANLRLSLHRPIRCQTERIAPRPCHACLSCYRWAG